MTFSNQGLGVGDIIERNYRQPIYRNFSNYRQIIDIENWIQFYSINTIESIVLKTGKAPRWLRWLTEKQQKSCSLPETFVAAKPTQTMVPDINLLWQAQLASMSNKNVWWLRRWWEYCGIFCFWLDWGLAKWWRGGGGHHSKSADKILRQRCEIMAYQCTNQCTMR